MTRRDTSLFLIFFFVCVTVCIYRIETERAAASAIINVVNDCLYEDRGDPRAEIVTAAYHLGASDCGTDEELNAQLIRAEYHLVISEEYRSILGTLLIPQAIVLALHIGLTGMAIRKNNQRTDHRSP
jgi:hypothetical protein